MISLWHSHECVCAAGAVCRQRSCCSSSLPSQPTPVCQWHLREVVVLMWKAEMSNQHVPWEKPAQRPELLPLTHCHCWKASDWNSQDGFCYAIFFLSPPGQSSLEVFVEEDVTNNLRWGYHFSRQEETTKKKKSCKEHRSCRGCFCIVRLWFCNWLFQVMSSPGVCWYFQASVVQTQPILFRSWY